MPSSSGGEAEPIDMKRNIALCLGLALWISAAASSALAHHSHPYFYDSCKSVTVEGRVNSVQWKDPHTLIEVKLDDGTAYSVDWAGLSALTRDGIAASDGPPPAGAIVVAAAADSADAHVAVLAGTREDGSDLDHWVRDLDKSRLIEQR